jgi:uncharacterized protein YigE (DUF2233 family)
MALEDELIQQINIMGMAINAAMRLTDLTEVGKYLCIGQTANSKVHLIIEQLRKDTSVCGEP